MYGDVRYRILQHDKGPGAFRGRVGPPAAGLSWAVGYRRNVVGFIIVFQPC